VGPVRLSLFLVTHPSNDSNAVVEIFAAGKASSMRVNMKAGEPRWITLGKFEFKGQGEEFVRIRHGGRGNIRLSALKLEVVDAKDGSIWQTLVLDNVVPYNPSKLLQTAPKNLREGPPNPELWKLTFSDEFNGSQLDTNVWKSAQGESWGQLLSARFPENAVVTNGLLRLVTKKENRGGKEWTSAMISTKSFRQKYGYWESRYRYAPATGLNQAFWMHPGGKDKDKVFEIDVNEGHYPSDVNATLHQSGLTSKSKRYVADYDLAADFHLYAAEWNEQEVIYYFDGREIYRVPNTKANLDMPVIYATAVLPWAGPINDSLNGASMDVDWVHVYQKKSEK
ncbi:MAG: family 16 glycosylhydrolase, partial [Verrucomicrobiota bacterium]